MIVLRRGLVGVATASLAGEAEAVETAAFSSITAVGTEGDAGRDETAKIVENGDSDDDDDDDVVTVAVGDGVKVVDTEGSLLEGVATVAAAAADMTSETPPLSEPPSSECLSESRSDRAVATGTTSCDCRSCCSVTRVVEESRAWPVPNTILELGDSVFAFEGGAGDDSPEEHGAVTTFSAVSDPDAIALVSKASACLSATRACETH